MSQHVQTLENVALVGCPCRMMRALEVFGGIWPTARVNEPHLKMPLEA
jgi:hypothetical protein